MWYIRMCGISYLIMSTYTCAHGDVKGQYWGSFLINLHLTKKKKKEKRKRQMLGQQLQVLTWLGFPVPSGNSQASLTPVPGDLRLPSSFRGHREDTQSTVIQADTATHKE